ncbi:hypothetical protein CBS147332_8414 [Penicillium roqueforti]|nr:hypothetical protein CBS147332_8414 [Penicillium roqueforti]KAI3125833.1 hypothetical protein CBS147331_827 [Penicillium roqueforti]
MGRKKTAQELVDFINSIPDSKMLGFTHGEHELFKDVNFRLDMQGQISCCDKVAPLHTLLHRVLEIWHRIVAYQFYKAFGI